MKRKETENLSDKERKIKRVERIVYGVLFTLGILSIGFASGWFGRWYALDENQRNLLWAIDTAKENYYEEIGDELYENLFGAFELDPYSTYYTKEAYDVIVAEREGQNRDLGFSVYGERTYLQAYEVAAGSSAERAGVQKGMRLQKFGKTRETLKTGTADEYFAFIGNLGANEKYFVQYGGSEANVVYETTIKEDEGNVAFQRKSTPMRIFRVVGNSPADRAGLERGMYVHKYGATPVVSEMISGSSKEMIEFVGALKPDSEKIYRLYMWCSFAEEFDEADAQAAICEIRMKEKEVYYGTYCYYRDNKTSYRFRSTEEGKKPEKVDTGEALTSLDDQTAYIALTEFMGNAAEEFESCLKLMKENKRKNLILDLRGNGGGYMDVFVKIASFMLKDAPSSGAQKVAYARFKNGATYGYSASKSLYSIYFEADSHVSVLADEYTASASECLIGALVDYKAVSFSDIYLRKNEDGEAKTYGKGIMQTHYSDSSGNTLKITSAKIFWPKSDKTIHGVGVTVSDGANEITSPLLPDQNDGFLREAVNRIQSNAANPSVNV